MTTQSGRHAHGFTLIEVLVTVLVLSLGLLGLAGMQLNALKSSHGSQLRNQASALSYEIGERIRSNRSAAEAGHYDIALAELPASLPDCEAQLCLASEMSAYDLGQWKTALTNQLPEGDGAISRSGRLVTVLVFWDERRSGAGGSDCDPSVPDSMACFEMSFIP